MPIPRRSFVIWNLENVRIFINRAFMVHDDYVRIVDGDYEFPDSDEQAEAIYENASDMLLAYKDIVARAALNEINSIIEHELKLVASAILADKTSKSMEESWQQSRKDAVKILRQYYKDNFKNDPSFESLAGYEEVELIRKIINAYKHDSGYGKEYDVLVNTDGVKVETQKQYELDVDDILNWINSSKKFINALPNLGLRLGADANRRLKITHNNKG